MVDTTQKINKVLADFVHNTMELEEVVLNRKPFKDISINEVHTVSAIGERKRATMSQIASDLGITISTLSISVNKLLRKGYVVRERSEHDRRIVYISLTYKGKLAYRLHRKFHHDLVKRAINSISEQEKEILLSSMIKLNDFCVSRINSIKVRER